MGLKPQLLSISGLCAAFAVALFVFAGVAPLPVLIPALLSISVQALARAYAARPSAISTGFLVALVILVLLMLPVSREGGLGAVAGGLVAYAGAVVSFPVSALAAHAVNVAVDRARDHVDVDSERSV